MDLWYLLWKVSDLLSTTQDHDLWLRGFWGCGGDLMVWCEIPRSQPQMGSKQGHMLFHELIRGLQETSFKIVTPAWYRTINQIKHWVLKKPNPATSQWCAAHDVCREGAGFEDGAVLKSVAYICISASIVNQQHLKCAWSVDKIFGAHHLQWDI